jgi:hypothetical protein
MRTRPQIAFFHAGGALGALAWLLGPTGHEVSCEQCFDLIDEYVELELADIEAGSLLPEVRAHLEGCSACNEDHESLRALLAQLDAERR